MFSLRTTKAALWITAITSLLGLTACSSNSSTNGSDACSALAQKCPYCTLPNLKATCENAVASHDPASCQNGLDDHDVKSNCAASDGGGGGDTGSGADTGSSLDTNGGADTNGGIDTSALPDSGGDTSDPCAELAKKCPYCTLPDLKATCEADVASHDTASCINGLNDHDIQSNCHP